MGKTTPPYPAAVRAEPGLIPRSDRGSQDASAAARALLARAGATASMSRAGGCYDNALAGRCVATLKTELAARCARPTREAARQAEWIAVRDNRQRLHSALGHRPPAEADEEAVPLAHAASPPRKQKPPLPLTEEGGPRDR